MKKKIWFFAVLFFIIAALASFYFDAKIVKSVSMIRTAALNNFFLGLTFLSSEIIILFFLTSLFLWSEKKRKWILPLWFTLFLTAAASFVLKISVQRLRPFQAGIVSTLPALMESAQNVWDFSFPSSHAMIAFCAIPILSKEFPRFKYVWIALAVLISFSRLYFGVHYLSDLISGGLIGYLIGFLIVMYEKENQVFSGFFHKFVKRK